MILSNTNLNQHLLREIENPYSNQNRRQICITKLPKTWIFSKEYEALQILTYQEYADTHRIFQSLLGICSQHDSGSNQQRTFSASKYGISEEVWTEKEVNLNHLRTFGCISYLHVELNHRNKLDWSPKGAFSLGTEQVSTAISVEFGEAKDP